MHLKKRSCRPWAEGGVDRREQVEPEPKIEVSGLITHSQVPITHNSTLFRGPLSYDWRGERVWNCQGGQHPDRVPHLESENLGLLTCNRRACPVCALGMCVCVCTVTVHSELQVTSGIFEGTADFPRFPGVGFSKIPHVTLFFFLMDSPYWGGPGWPP